METESRITDWLNKQSNAESQKSLEANYFKWCGKCTDGFIVFKDDEGRIMAAECECMKKYKEEKKLKFANIPELMKKITLQDVKLDVYREQENKKVVVVACKTIKEYINHFEEMKKRGQGIYLWSETRGSGKTHLIVALANKLMESNQVKFATSGQIINAIKETYGKNGSYTENDLLADICTTEILIIDDFGSEKITDWVNEKFYHIINQRYMDNKVTMFTSNTAINDLPYDKRITNRICEKVFELHYAEESIREHKAEENQAEIIRILKGGC